MVGDYGAWKAQQVDELRVVLEHKNEEIEELKTLVSEAAGIIACAVSDCDADDHAWRKEAVRFLTKTASS